MGRLFWKFFFFLWLAQFLTSLGVGVAIWGLRGEHGRPPDFAPHAGAGNGPPINVTDHAHLSPHFRPPRPPPPRFLPPLMPLIAGSFVSLLFAGLLAWYFSRPIHTLRKALESLANGKLDTRVAAAMGKRRDELADLGSDFDRMAERLQGLLDTQKRLLHDVSHELRSPLARLQAVVGLMRQQPARVAELIERVERDTARMDLLVGELLTLARVESGGVGNMVTTVDLARLVSSLAEDLRFEAESKHCSVRTEINRPLQVLGSEELLRRALENVLRNALRHSPLTGEITVGAKLDAGSKTVVISIVDQGHGVVGDDCERIFQAFYRSEVENEMETGTGTGPGAASSGYGLGLAIARRVVEAHGGSIEAINSVERGFEIRVSLPVVQRSD